jgi:hypothetical protein
MPLTVAYKVEADEDKAHAQQHADEKPPRGAPG